MSDESLEYVIEAIGQNEIKRAFLNKNL
jgi:hypothetical protein